MSAEGLRVRRLGLDTYGERVVVVNRDCPAFAVEGFQSLARVEVRVKERSITAVLVISDDAALVGPKDVGLATASMEALGAEPGTPVEIRPPQPIRSLGAVRRKISGETLGADDYRAIVEEIVAGAYTKTELAAFVVACAMDGLERDEVVHLTRAMGGTGRSLSWKRKPIVDKHCIGGIPGNRTSMIVVPIVAAHGLAIPKTSSRAITSPAGTADTMECLARVNMEMEEMQAVVERHNGCICWGGAVNLSPADDILISVERPLALDAEGQMVASILSKKVAAGSTHILLDIPVGPTAKVRSHDRAERLRKLFRYVAHALGLHLEVMFTDGASPIGRGVGPALEARDVLQVLHTDSDAPPDLREKSLQLAGRVLEFDPKVEWGTGYETARRILDSHQALEAMEAIRAAQGRCEPPDPSPVVHEIPAARSGRLLSLDNYVIARTARLAGAPTVRGAGVDLLVPCGRAVKSGEPLLRIHAARAVDLQFAREYIESRPQSVQVR